MNGIFQSACVIVIFPTIVSIGAGAATSEGMSTRVARFFGDVSYPLYITHYPLIYLYKRWSGSGQVTVTQGALYGSLLFVVALTVAYACLKLYDEPARAWLARRFVARRSQTVPTETSLARES